MQVGDFQFVQESKLESQELLRDVTTAEDTELSYGKFDLNNFYQLLDKFINDHNINRFSNLIKSSTY